MEQDFAVRGRLQARADDQGDTINGGEVDLKVRDAKLEGTVAAEWTDVDGDRYASPGDTVTYTYTVGNAGNVALTDLVIPDALSEPALAVGATVSASRKHVLIASDVAAGRLEAVTFDALANNGKRAVKVSVTGGEILLNRQPENPADKPEVSVQELDGQASPLDLGTAEKYSNGQKVTLQGLEYGQWYYVYLNKHTYRLGWIFPTTADTVEFVLPADVQSGRDDVVVLDQSGKQVAFDRLQVTPKGVAGGGTA